MSRFTAARAKRWESDSQKALDLVEKLLVDSQGIYLNAKGGRQQRVMQYRHDLKHAQLQLQGCVASAKDTGKEFK